MKAPYLVLLIFFISCSSSKNTASTKLYPNNGENLLKKFRGNRAIGYATQDC